MNMENINLLVMGLLGILIHNFMKMDDRNRAEEGNINLWKYWRIERFSIMISVSCVIAMYIYRPTDGEIQRFGDFKVSLAYLATGLAAQSFVRWVLELIRVKFPTKRKDDDTI